MGDKSMNSIQGCFRACPLRERDHSRHPQALPPSGAPATRGDIRAGRWRRIATLRQSAVIALAVMAAAPGFTAVGAAKNPYADHDVTSCKGRLNRIFEAIQEYQKVYKTLPNYLSDLHPEFIADPRLFICPAVRRKGDFQTWRRGLRAGVFEDVLPTSYSYEFCVKEYPLWAGISSTEREYKLRQMKLLGSNVPIVRCLAHKPTLNLSIGGSIYDCFGEWEDNFTNLVAMAKLLPDEAFKDLAPLPGIYTAGIRTRDPAANPRLLDLSAQYVVPLDRPWLFRNPRGQDLSALPQGVVKLELVSVSFDIRGVVHLRGQSVLVPFPERIEGMPVGQRCERIHFLQGAVCGDNVHSDFAADSPGTEIGRYEIRYADGGRLAIPIRYGHDVLGWNSTEPNPAAGGARVAWEGQIRGSKGQARPVRLYHQEWLNPRPDAPIATIDFVASDAVAAPFLIAITLDP